MTARRIVIVPVGSHGDVNPLGALGRALADRGHDCVVVANERFQSGIEGCGLRFRQAGSIKGFEQAIRDARSWDPRRSFDVVLKHVLGAMAPCMREIDAEAEKGPFVLVGSTWALACRVAREKFGAPLATIHVSPAGIRSADAPPLRRLGGEWTQRLPKPIQRAAFALEDVRLRRVAGRRIEDFARKNGVALRVGSLLGDFVHSPDVVAGLWPEWFAPQQRDWPAKAMLCGFPLFAGNEAVDAELDSWIGDGAAPVLVAPASANPRAGAFVAASIAACERAGRRALVATAFREQLPNPLPAFSRHASWVPYAAVLPRCAAIIHQGGIGTAALAFAAGVPQLAVPQSHDQFDHAQRIERLGAGRAAMAETPSAEAVAAALAEVLESPTIRTRAGELAVRAREGCDWDRVCGAIEGLQR